MIDVKLIYVNFTITNFSQRKQMFDCEEIYF